MNGRMSPHFNFLCNYSPFSRRRSSHLETKVWGGGPAEPLLLPTEAALQGGRHQSGIFNNESTGSAVFGFQGGFERCLSHPPFPELGALEEPVQASQATAGGGGQMEMISVHDESQLFFFFSLFQAGG